MCYSFRKIKNKQKSICTNAPNKYHLLRLIQIIIIKIIFSNFCFPICGSRCQNYVTMPAHLWWFLCGSTIFLCHLVKSNQWNNFQWTCCRLKQTEKQKSNEWSLMSAWAVFCPSSLNHINSIKWKHHKKSKKNLNKWIKYFFYLSVLLIEQYWKRNGIQFATQSFRI